MSIAFDRSNGTLVCSDVFSGSVSLTMLNDSLFDDVVEDFQCHHNHHCERNLLSRNTSQMRQRI